MAKSFKVNSSISSYNVDIGNNISVDFLKGDYRDFILICDKDLISKYEFLSSHSKIIEVEANELSKDLSEISVVIKKLLEFSLKRGDTIIGVGGGVIQDITCFVSSIYMRGVNWSYFPTTFLGMCDSCIGGKSSINVDGVKNLVGNFYPPQNIIIDVDFINSLPSEQIDSGICEAIKICFASAKDDSFEKIVSILDINADNKYLDIVELTLSTKKWFIENDEFDQEERQLLNFGHTFGHAIEGSSNYAIPHGIAVGFGMLWSMFFSYKIYNYGNQPRVKKLQDRLLSIVDKYPDFKQVINSLDCEDVMLKFIKDKKHKVDKYTCILINEEGFLVKDFFNKDAEFDNLFATSLNDLKKIIND